MKRCFKCGATKPLSEFYRHPMMADGHLNKCKSCTRRDVSRNYRENIEHYVEYERRRNQEPSRREAKRHYLQQRRHLHPDKARAWAAVTYAVRTGKIKRQPCRKCGAARAEAHHWDYSRPLDVHWLCFRCHRAEHGQEVHGP